ncbi:MAG: peptide ABC transporter substrate-binding protein, partial [Candidatus Baltobacteraceae bacterium]
FLMRQRAFAALAALLLFSGCGARNAETRDPNIVICAWISAPESFNPFTTVSAAATMIQDLIYTKIVDLGPDLRPRWSTSFASKIAITNGGRTYTLHLHSGGRWADGAPITADDLVFSLKLASNTHLLAGNSGDFALLDERSVRRVDRNTVVFTLSSPSPPFLENALSETFIVPEHLFGHYPPQSQAEATFINSNQVLAHHPFASGAFTIKRVVPDSYLIIEPNPGYWGPKPFLNEIAFRVYPQQDSLYAAVDAGEVDVTDIAPNLWRVHTRLRGNHRAVTWPWNVAFVLLPNFRSRSAPFLRERAVRQAMLYAINRPFIIKGIMSGEADRLNGPIPSFSPYYNRYVPKYPFDPARARALLDEAGWKLQGGVRSKNGAALRFTLKTGGATDAVASNIAELVQANLRGVGIDCRLDNEELQTFFDDIHHSKFEVALRGTILQAYPDDYKDYYSTQTVARGGYNLGFYDNAQVDKAIDSARVAQSKQQARADLNRYQKLAATELPALYLYSNRLGAIVPSWMTGFDLTPLAPAALPMGLQFWRRRI